MLRLMAAVTALTAVMLNIMMAPAKAAVINEHPVPELVSVAAAENELRIVACFFDSQTVFLSPTAAAELNYRCAGLTPGSEYTVSAQLFPEEAVDAQPVELSAAFQAEAPKYDGRLEIPLQNIPGQASYRLKLTITSADGKTAAFAESVYLTVVSPQVTVSILQQGQTLPDQPLILYVQTDVRNIEPGDGYTIRCALRYREESEPLQGDDGEYVLEQPLDAAGDGLPQTYSDLATFTVPEDLIMGRGLVATSVLLRDGLQIGSGETERTFYPTNADGQVPIVKPTPKATSSSDNLHPAATEGIQTSYTADTDQIRETVERLAADVDAQKQSMVLRTVISYAILGGVCLVLWIVWRRKAGGHHAGN